MEVALIEASDSTLVANLFPLYVYDMSEYMGWGPDEMGLYAPGAAGYVAEYWQKDDHYPYLIKADGELAGFVLLRRFPEDPERYDIGQFFVLRKFKRQGIGKLAFEQAVSRFPGLWLTRVLNGNTGALEFWQSVIRSEAVGDIDIQLEMDGDVEMHFIRYVIE